MTGRIWFLPDGGFACSEACAVESDNMTRPHAPETSENQDGSGHSRAD